MLDMNEILDAFEHIKSAPTIYCGLGSDIYTLCYHECKKIENALNLLKKIKELLEGM